MQQSDNINEIAAAMAQAAAELRDVEHDAKNSHLRNRYATLSAVLTTARPILQANGLTLTQWLGGDIGVGDRVTVTTQLTHTSGQWMRSTVGAVVEQGKGISVAQAGGSQVSYLRRYSALAALGISSADDVDGHLPQYDGGRDARPHQAPKATPAPQAAPAPTRWSDGERARFCAIVSGWGIKYDTLAAWCESKGRPRPSGMSSHQREKLLGWLEAMDADSRIAAVGGEP